MRVLIFFTLLAAVVALAFWRGGREERIAALTCVIGTALTIIVADPRPQRFADFAPAMLAIDVGVFLTFASIALRSDRFWPMWAAGLQLNAPVVHLLKLLQPDLLPFVLGVALAFWSYPILLVIGAGALRTQIIERWRRELDVAPARAIS